MEETPYTGTVYILHFKRPIGHARHYTGFAARDLARRLADHEIGRGARLTRVAIARHILWDCTYTCPGDRALERHFKRVAAAPRLCPLCHDAYNARARERRRLRRARKEAATCGR